MFGFFRRGKQTKGFDPKQEIVRLSEFSPPSALVYLQKSGKQTGGEPEELGKAFFLRRDKKLYSDGNNIYITTPDNIKISRDQNLHAQDVTLQFFHRRIPHRIECRIVGRFRLLPEVTETLDFNAKAAYKLSPTGHIRKDEKRQYLRYTLKNFGDSRVPLTTHVTFELFLKTTNKEFPASGTPAVLLNDLKLIPYKDLKQPQLFTTRDSINAFRDLMLKKQAHLRSVHVTKVQREEAVGMARKPDVPLLLGEINILGLEMESLRDVVYLKKSAKAGIRKGEENPYNLRPGERVITDFAHAGINYEMICEVMEARTQNEVVRPTEFLREETGLKVGLVDFSSGGLLVESNADLLKFVLGEKCPAKAEEERDFESEYWQKALAALRTPMLELTLYPQRHFPDAVKKFEPELPFKFSMLAQIVRTKVVQVGEKKILQHGLQFAYEPQAIPLKADELVPWRYIRYLKDNDYFKLVHSRLSQLYGHLENQSLSSRTR
jgi:hypothetical protein